MRCSRLLQTLWPNPKSPRDLPTRDMLEALNALRNDINARHGYQDGAGSRRTSAHTGLGHTAAGEAKLCRSRAVAGSGRHRLRALAMYAKPTDRVCHSTSGELRWHHL